MKLRGSTESMARRQAMGDVIRTYRVERGLSQSDLGRRMDDVPQTTVSRWEMGLIEMTFEQVRDVEDALALRRGIIGTLSGYISPSFEKDEVEEMLRVDPRLHPDLREDLLKIYRTCTSISRRLR